MGAPADFLDDWLDAEVFALIEESLPTINESVPPSSSGGTLFDLLKVVSRQQSGLADELLDPPTACGTADGSGGVPRIGGGADLAVSDVPVHSAPDLTGHLGSNTRLVVIDEFDFAGILGVGSTFSDPALGAENPWSDWLGYLGWQSLEALDGVPHGHFVGFHLLEVSGDSNATVTTHTMDDGKGHITDYAVVSKGSMELWLVAIDFSDIWTAVWAIDALSMNGSAPSVLNLSWYIIDCDFLKDYEASFGRRVTNVSDQFLVTSEQLLSDYGPDVETLCSVAQSLVPYAPDCASLLAVAGMIDMQLKLDMYTNSMALRDQLSDVSLTVVAAAGNEGLPGASKPAHWPSVIGVAACEVGTADRVKYSNAPSEKSGGGSWPTMAPGSRFGFSAAYPMRYYWGTSFAAPHVALLLAASGGAQLSEQASATLQC
jgi:hypothetical protein